MVTYPIFWRCADHKGPEESIEGKDIIIVEDIIDRAYFKLLAEQPTAATLPPEDLYFVGQAR